MMHKFITIPEIIYYKAFAKIKRIEGCFYKHKTIDQTKRIVLYLDYPKFIHLGDTLWFEPIARMLAAHADLAVCCNPQMGFYFRRLGYTVIDKSSVRTGDLLVARTELAHPLRGKDVIWVNFNFSRITRPVINEVINDVSACFGVPAGEAKPRAIEISPQEQNRVAEKFNLDPESDYAVFNNYIDSHKLGMSHRDRLKAESALLRFAGKFKNDSGVKLLHAATKADQAKDTRHYDFVDLDLRGLTSIEECFVLASLDNVVKYAGFDTFWLHLFNLYNKASYIMIRPGFSETLKRQIKNYVAVPYEAESGKVNFIN